MEDQERKRRVGKTVACTRCGYLHTDAEETRGRRLSCTEVKQYWRSVRNDHKKLYGHLARIGTDDSGNRVCLKCKRRLYYLEE